MVEFQTYKERRRSRNFWDEAGAEMDEEQMRQKQKQQSVMREEMNGEFLKKFAPRLEQIIREYEKRDIEPDEEMNDYESLRWWAQHGETRRLLPTLRSLAEQLEPEE